LETAQLVLTNELIISITWYRKKPPTKDTFGFKLVQ